MATIRISMKTPDAVDYALEDLPEEEREEAKTILERWFEWGEAVTIEVDLTKKTAKVLTTKE